MRKKEKMNAYKRRVASKEKFKEIKKVLVIEKTRKVERYVVFLIYALLFLVGGYFLLINVNPDILSDSFYDYEVSASDYLIDNKLRSLYLDDMDVLGGELKIDGESVRLIISEKPFNFVFNPKRKIFENSSAEVEISFVGTGTEVYLNEILIIPDLDGFEKVADFENRAVWVKEELVKSNYTESDNSGEFIYANFPGRNIYSFGEIDGGSPVIADYKKEITFIETRFRDNLKLAVYAEGDLKIDFVKQDLNWYLGKDEYTVKIIDLQGNVYFDEIYEDDGEKRKGREGSEKKFVIEVNDLPRNIYYVTFTKDGNNKASDSTIKEIKINSNKVLIVGRNLPLEEFEFYMDVGFPQKIGFNYWHNGKDQKIVVSGSESRVIDLNESYKGVKYEEEFGRGEYTFVLPKGDVWVYSSVISPSEENWFYLPRGGDKKLINQDIIVINKNRLKIGSPKDDPAGPDEVVYTGIIKIEEGSKIRIQVLDKLEIYFKNIKLVL